MSLVITQAETRVNVAHGVGKWAAARNDDDVLFARDVRDDAEDAIEMVDVLEQSPADFDHEDRTILLVVSGFSRTIIIRAQQCYCDRRRISGCIDAEVVCERRHIQPRRLRGISRNELAESRDDPRPHRRVPRPNPLNRHGDRLDLLSGNGVSDARDIGGVEQLPIRADDPRQPLACEFACCFASVRRRDAVVPGGEQIGRASCRERV